MKTKFLLLTAVVLCLLPPLAHARSLESQGAAMSLRADDGDLDDPVGRMRAEREAGENELSPDFLKWLNKAAARERERNKSLLPGTESAVPGSTWVNLGPNKADFAKWDTGTLNKTDAGRVVSIVPDPTDADILYVAMSGGGVWKTTNAFSAAQPTWSPLTETLGSLSCGALAIDPANPATLYLGLGDAFSGAGIGFTKSTDGGTTWQPIVYLGDSTKISDIHVAETNSSVLLVATDKGLYRSTDSGATFTLVSLATGNTAVNTIIPDPNDSATLYAGTYLGVYRSTDTGTSWSRFGAGLPLVSVTDFYISPDSTRMRAATFGRGFWELRP